MNRRSLLTLLGMSPVAAPAAVSAMVDTPPPAPNTYHWGRDFVGGQSLSGLSGDQKIRALVARGVMTRDQMVDHVLRSMDVHYSIDPDIAAMKSFSAVTKARMQRRREAERQIDSYLEDGRWNTLFEAGARLVMGDA